MKEIKSYMKLIIDSSVFVSSLGKADEYSTDSRSFFKRFINQQIIVPSLVVAEVITILKKQGGQNLGEILKYLLSLTLFPLNETLIAEIIYLPKSVFTLKTSDLIVALTAKIEKGTLVTWDKQLLRYSVPICSVQSPKKIVI